MLLIYKNKGPLVILYFAVCVILMALAGSWIRTLTGNTFLRDHVNTGIGLGSMVAGAWTWLTKDDYYKNKDGIKRKMDTVSSLYFIPMKWWAVIFVALGLVLIGRDVMQAMSE